MRPKFLPTYVALPKMRDLVVVAAASAVVARLVKHAELEYERELEPPASKKIIRFEEHKEGKGMDRDRYPNLYDAEGYGDVAEKALILFDGNKDQAEEWLGKPNPLLGGHSPLYVASLRMGEPNSGEDFLCRMMDAYINEAHRLEREQRKGA